MTVHSDTPAIQPIKMKNITILILSKLHLIVAESLALPLFKDVISYTLIQHDIVGTNG